MSLVFSIAVLIKGDKVTLNRQKIQKDSWKSRFLVSMINIFKEVTELTNLVTEQVKAINKYIYQMPW